VLPRRAREARRGSWPTGYVCFQVMENAPLFRGPVDAFVTPPETMSIRPGPHALDG